MTPVLINLPDWARERLRQIAEQEGVGLSELIEKWIMERTERLGPPRKVAPCRDAQD